MTGDRALLVLTVAAIALTVLASGVGLYMRRRHALASPPPLAAVSPPPEADGPCATPGVRFFVDGIGYLMPAIGEDSANEVHGADGSWAIRLAVGGHQNMSLSGGSVPGDVGKSVLYSLHVVTDGISGGFDLGKEPRGTLTMTRSDDFLAGNFEGDVLVTKDGGEVVRLAHARGTFCLPNRPRPMAP